MNWSILAPALACFCFWLLQVDVRSAVRVPVLVMSAHALHVWGMYVKFE